MYEQGQIKKMFFCDVVSKSWVAIVIVGILMGSIYAVGISKYNIEPFCAIYSLKGGTGQVLNLAVLSGIWLKYFKKIIIVWLTSCFEITYPISCVLIYSTIFSYGFTAVSLIFLPDEFTKILVIIILCIQGVVEISANLCILCYKRVENFVENSKITKKIINIFIISSFISIILSIINIILTYIITF